MSSEGWDANAVARAALRYGGVLLVGAALGWSFAWYGQPSRGAADLDRWSNGAGSAPPVGGALTAPIDGGRPAAGVFGGRDGDRAGAGAIVPDQWQDPSAALAVGHRHRERRFAEVANLSDTLKLPGDFTQSEGLYTLVGRSQWPALEQLLGEAQALADGSDQATVTGVIFARMVELDPVRALTTLAILERNREPAVAAIFFGWGNQDPEQALAHFDQVPSDLSQAAALALLRAQQELSPVALRRFAARLPPGVDGVAVARRVVSIRERMAPQQSFAAALATGRSAEIERAAMSWGRRDPQAALAALERAAITDSLRVRLTRQLTRLLAERGPIQSLEEAEALPEPQRTAAMAGFYRALARTDPEEAWQGIAGLASSPDVDRARTQVLQMLARHDPERSVQLASGSGTATELSAVLQIAVRRLLELEDVLGAAALVATVSDPAQRDRAQHAIMESVAAVDPRQALPLLATMTAPEIRQRAVASLARVWATSDPVAARDWALSLAARERGAAVQSVMQFWARQDLTAARAAVDSLPADNLGAGLQAVAMQLASEDPQDAVDWLTGYLDRDGFQPAVVQTMGRLASAEPAVAAGYLDRLPAPVRLQLTSTVATHWARRDVAAAAAWARGLSDANGSAAQVAVASAWARADFPAAFTWTRGLPRGSVRDNALGRLLDANPGSDDALRVLAAIEKPALRHAHAKRLVNRGSVARSDAQAVLPPGADLGN